MVILNHLWSREHSSGSYRCNTDQHGDNIRGGPTKAAIGKQHSGRTFRKELYLEVLRLEDVANQGYVLFLGRDQHLGRNLKQPLRLGREQH